MCFFKSSTQPGINPTPGLSASQDPVKFDATQPEDRTSIQQSTPLARKPITELDAFNGRFSLPNAYRDLMQTVQQCARRVFNCFHSLAFLSSIDSPRLAFLAL